MIRTHTDTNNIHNHIVVNMVNYETGKMLENKKYHLHRLRDLNDKLCLTHGLSVIDRNAKKTRARLPDKVLRMERFNRFSYIFDTKQKADFARKYATSHDEYIALLGQLGISARVENKNITYFYPGFNRGKRGDTLGKSYAKEGLEAAFKKNDETFSAHPELRAKVAGEIHAVLSGIQKIPKEKDYTKFTKIQRGTERKPYPFHKEIMGTMMPLDEIRRARTGSIFEYCKRNRIELKMNDKGEMVLQNRPFVMVRDTEWTNTKSKTQGTLIEFVAAHKNKSFIQAIAEINNNPRLLLLEQHFGEQKRTFTSFYFPKEESMDWHSALQHFHHFLSLHNASPESARFFLKKQQVQVAKNGVIRLFGKEDPNGALEFTRESNGSWISKQQGKINAPFFSSRGTGTSAIIYTDPFSLFQHQGKGLIFSGSRSHGILGLLVPNHELIDNYVAKNKHVKELFFVIPSTKNLSTQELDFFGNLKKRYLNLGISVCETPNPPNLHREVQTLTR